MEKAQAFTVENFICNWNGEFPDYPLTATDLKIPQAVMGALFQVFNRLDIDREAVLKPPPEDCNNDHLIYYWDLLPVINMTRVINKLVAVMPQCNATISVTHLLQPVATTSHSILLLLFNLMLFNEERLRDIAPHEEELFAKSEQIKFLEDRKNKLSEMINEQAIEKGKRGERLKKLDTDIKQLDEQLRPEKEAHDEEKQELEAALKEIHQIEVVLEQKKGHRDTALAEVERKRALRVYDAEDIRAQAEQAARNVQEAEEKLNSLKASLMQKENCLKNLQTIKPSLDTANNLLHEVMKISESLKDYEAGDLESESKEGELDVLNTELSELQVQLSELRTAREEARKKRQESQAKRQHKKMMLESAFHDVEEKDKKCRERCKWAKQRVKEIKDATAKYQEEKVAGMKKLEFIKETFSNELKTLDELLLKKTTDIKNVVEEKLHNRSL